MDGIKSNLLDEGLGVCSPGPLLFHLRRALEIDLEWGEGVFISDFIEGAIPFELDGIWAYEG